MADDYQNHYETDVAEHLRRVTGFRGARLLREDGDEVMFMSVTFFDSIEDVRRFAGDRYERAVVEEAAQRALSRWDDHVSHLDVAAEIQA